MGPQEDYIETVLTCEGDFYDPAFHKQLQLFSDKLQQLLLTGENNLILKKVEPWNSVRVTFNIPKEAAQRLKQLAERGDHTLRQLGILAVQIEGDKVISLTIAGKNNETTELVFRTTNSNVHSHGGASTPGSMFDSSDEMNLPGPSNVEATRKNIAEYLSQQGNIETGIFDSVINQPGPSGEVFKSPNVVTTQCDPIPFRPPNPGQFGITVSSPSQSPGNHQQPMIQPPGRSPTGYPSPTSVMSSHAGPQGFPAGIMAGVPGFSGHGQLSPKLSNSSSQGPMFPVSTPPPQMMASGCQSPGAIRAPLNIPLHTMQTMNNMQRMVGANRDLTSSSPLLVNLLQNHSEAAGHFNNLIVNRMPPPMDTSPQPPKRRRKPRKPKDKGQALPQSAGGPMLVGNMPSASEAEAGLHSLLHPQMMEEQRVPAIPGVPLPPSVSASPNSPGAATAAAQGRSPSMAPELHIPMDHIINPYTGQMEPIDKALESPSKNSDRSASHSPAHSAEDFMRAAGKIYNNPGGANAPGSSQPSPRRDSATPGSDHARPKTPKGHHKQSSGVVNMSQLHNDTSESIPHSTPGGVHASPHSPRAMAAASDAGLTSVSSGIISAVSVPASFSAAAQELLNSFGAAKAIEMGLGNAAMLLSNPLLQQQTENFLNNESRTNPLLQANNPLLQGINPILQGGPIGQIFQQGNMNPLSNEVIMAGNVQSRASTSTASGVTTATVVAKNDLDMAGVGNPHISQQSVAGTVVTSITPEIISANPLLQKLTVHPISLQSGNSVSRAGDLSNTVSVASLAQQMSVSSTVAPHGGMVINTVPISQMAALSSQQRVNLLSTVADDTQHSKSHPATNAISSGNPAVSTATLTNSPKASANSANAFTAVSATVQNSNTQSAESKLSSELNTANLSVSVSVVSVCPSSGTSSVTTNATPSLSCATTTTNVQVNMNTHENAFKDATSSAKPSSLTSTPLHTSHVNRQSPTVLTNNLHEHFNHDSSDHSSTQSYEGLTSATTNAEVKENHTDALSSPQDSTSSAKASETSSNPEGEPQIVNASFDRNIITVGMALEEKLNTEALITGLNDKLLSLKSAKLDMNYIQKTAAAQQQAQFGLHHKIGMALAPTEGAGVEKVVMAMTPGHLKSSQINVSAPATTRNCDSVEPSTVNANRHSEISKKLMERSDLNPGGGGHVPGLEFQQTRPVNGDAFLMTQDQLLFQSNGNLPLNRSALMLENLPVSKSVPHSVHSSVDLPISSADLGSLVNAQRMDTYNNAESSVPATPATSQQDVKHEGSGGVSTSVPSSGCDKTSSAVQSILHNYAVATSGVSKAHIQFSQRDNAAMTSTAADTVKNNNPIIAAMVAQVNSSPVMLPDLQKDGKMMLTANMLASSASHAIPASGNVQHSGSVCLTPPLMQTNAIQKQHSSPASDRRTPVSGSVLPSSVEQTHQSASAQMAAASLLGYSAADTTSVPPAMDVTYTTNAFSNALMAESVNVRGAYVPGVGRQAGMDVNKVSMPGFHNVGMSTSTCGLTVPGQGEPLSTLASIASTTCVVQSSFSSVSSNSLMDIPTTMASMFEKVQNKALMRQLSEPPSDPAMDFEINADYVKHKNKQTEESANSQSPKRASKPYTVSKLLDESKKERARQAALLAAGVSTPRPQFTKSKTVNALDMNMAQRNSNLHLNFVSKSLHTPPLLNSTPHPITAPCFPLNLTESVQKVMKAIPSGDGLMPRLPASKPMTSKSSPRSSPCAKTNLSLSPPQSKRKALMAGNMLMPAIDTEVAITSVPNMVSSSYSTGLLQTHHHKGSDISVVYPGAASVTPPAEHLSCVSPSPNNNPEQIYAIDSDAPYGNLDEKNRAGVNMYLPSSHAGGISGQVDTPNNVSANELSPTSSLLSSASSSSHPQELSLVVSSASATTSGNHAYTATTGLSAFSAQIQTGMSSGPDASLSHPPHTPTPPPTPLSQEATSEHSLPLSSKDAGSNSSSPEHVTTHSIASAPCETKEEQGATADAESTSQTQPTSTTSTPQIEDSTCTQSVLTSGGEQHQITGDALQQDEASSQVTGDAVTSDVREPGEACADEPQPSHLSSSQPTSPEAVAEPQQISSSVNVTTQGCHSHDTPSQDAESAAAAAVEQTCSSPVSEEQLNLRLEATPPQQPPSASEQNAAPQPVSEDSVKDLSAETQQNMIENDDGPIQNEASIAAVLSEPTIGKDESMLEETEAGKLVEEVEHDSAIQSGEVDGQQVASPVMQENVSAPTPLVSEPLQVLPSATEEQTLPQVNAWSGSADLEQNKAAATVALPSGGAPLSPAVINAECAPSQPSTPEFSSNVAKLVRQKSSEDVAAANTESTTSSAAEVSHRSSRGSTESVTSTCSKEESTPSSSMNKVEDSGPRTRRKTMSESSDRSESPLSKLPRTESPTPTKGKRSSSAGRKKGSTEERPETPPAAPPTQATDQIIAKDEQSEEASKQTNKATRGSKRKLVVQEEEPAVTSDLGGKKSKLEGSTAAEAESQAAVTPVSKPMENEHEEYEQKGKGKTPPKIVAGNLKVATGKTATTPDDSTTSPKTTSKKHPSKQTEEVTALETIRRGVTTRPKKVAEQDNADTKEAMTDSSTAVGNRRGKAKLDLKNSTDDGVEGTKNGGKKVNAEVIKTELGQQVEEAKRGQGRRNAERSGRRSPTVAEDKSPGRVNRVRAKQSPPRETKTAQGEKKEDLVTDSVYKRATRSSKPKGEDHFELPPPASKRRRASRDHR